jgi:hypothetical protein
MEQDTLRLKYEVHGIKKPFWSKYPNKLMAYARRLSLHRYSKSMIVLEVSCDVEVDAAFFPQYSWSEEPLPQMMTPEIVIRYKNAAEIFEQHELYNNSQSMVYQTFDAIRETFINSCFFALEEKENNRFAHTL